MPCPGKTEGAPESSNGLQESFCQPGGLRATCIYEAPTVCAGLCAVGRLGACEDSVLGQAPRVAA